jgi:hypothetical protein
MKSRLLSSFFVVALLSPLAAWPQMSVSITMQPPPLPVYVQPPVPGDGYIWTPGYWAWSPSDGDYFWIPGTWVRAPRPGYLWTPGYWGFYGNAYRWNVGYWGSQVGFYGGINYGYGYGGSGYQGGRWDRGSFQYNESVTNVNRTVVHNVYNTRVENNYKVPRVSYNGGPQGITARPTATERQVQTGSHMAPMPDQVQHERAAMAAPEQRASMNHGTPPLAATPRLEAPNAAQRQAPPAAQRPTPAPARAESPQKSQPPAVNSQPAARQAAPPQAHAQPATQQVQQAAKPERPAQAQPKPEQRAQPQAAQPRPEQRAQPQPTQPKPEQRAQAQPAQPKPAQPKPEQRAQPQAAQRAQPQQAQPQQAQPKAEARAQPQPAQPKPQADRPQPQAKAEPRGQQRQNDER